MGELYLVDSHVHFWDPMRLDYPWLAALPDLNRPFLQTDFAIASASTNVQKLIFVEGGCKSVQNLTEVDWVSSLASIEPRIKGIVAHASLEKGKGAHAELATLASRPLVKGVRRSLQGEQDPDFCIQPEFVAGVKLLAEFCLTFDVCIRHDQLPGVAELARRVPQVSFILDHLGKPDVRGRRTEPWAAELKELAMLPNVVCKISGLTTEADWHTWQPADLQFYVEHALEVFGFDRVMFGSDWPVATLATNYLQWVEVVRKLIPSGDDPADVKLFQANAERIYRV
jgi:L-fuconolactonase